MCSSNLYVSDMFGCFTQRWPCSPGGWLRPGLCGGRHPLRSQHDVFGATLPPCGGVQPQRLFGIQLWTHLFRPRGKIRLAISQQTLIW